MRKLPATFEFENSLWGNNKSFLVGLDEVGRGAWAGPLVAAAVIFPPNYQTKYKYYDSKLLKPYEREELDKIIRKEALAFGFGIVDPGTIVSEGLTKANQLAFKQAVKNLNFQIDHYLVDAFKIKHLPAKIQTPIIHGDYFCASIAAASIVAKVFRDRLMRQFGKVYKVYKFGYNKGYGTKAHQEAILKFGLSEIHRTNYNLQILR